MQLSRSKLADISVSPFYFHQKHIAKTFTVETPAMDFGSAFHCAVLEPNEFDKRFSFCGRRSKAEKENYDYLIEQGYTILGQSQMDQLNALRSVFANNADAQKILKALPIVEQKIEFEYRGHKFTGVPDACNDSIIADAKTTDKIKSVREFTQDMIKYHNVEQVFLYCYAKNIKPNNFYFICVSKSEPYEIKIYSANQEIYDFGKMQVDAQLDKYEQCVEQWGIDPDVPWIEREIIDLELPAWASTQLLQKENKL